ncbi:PilX N-terminal domain-containing pilus assembly protein [Endozoicomonas arenosclerae]|uniref:PilX N-terminal domain-containing pilus assembly protein n=1 Tax=Endozoicomonas arenosclerae TaxID=1633495 RepID=UPI00078533C0|nr:PilX N-terminal domain-containing pilus assembly protein [Endozoicomonas arenosclerae]
MSNIAPSNSERGAILFISLIILLLVTVIAIGSVRYATLDQRISLTVQQKNTTFQAAESGLSQNENAMNFKFAIDQARVDGYTETFTFTDTSGSQVTAQATTRQVGIVQGQSLRSDGLKLYRFRTESNATMNNANTVTDLEAGFVKAVLD